MTTQDQLDPQRLGPNDRDDQARLFGRCFQKPANVEALRWRYDRNPHGEAVSLALRGEDGKAVCSYAYVPRLAVCRDADGVEATGVIGQQGDVMTDPDWQRQGLARRLVQTCAEETRAAGFVLNWGFPNRQSAPVFLKFGWHSVGVIRPRRCILQADAAARERRMADGRLAALKVGLDRRKSLRARRKLGSLPRGLAVRPIERFEPFAERIAVMSQAVEARFAFMLRRDATFLDWRFVDTPSKLHRSFGVFDADDVLQGYFVVQPPHAGGARGVGYLVEFLCPDEALVGPLMASALDQLEALGTSVAEAWSVDASWWQKQLGRAGFLDAKSENHLYVYCFVLDESHALGTSVRDASAWYLTDGDRDDELMG